jgi:hypothetical protein
MSDANTGTEMSAAPRADRPYVEGYGIPETEEGMLPWSHVEKRMAAALTYWISTVDEQNRPHATPVWGVWMDGTLFFDGSPSTRRGRNLAENTAVAVHLESGTDVVIVHGEALQIKEPDLALAGRLAAAYTAKYREMGYSPAVDTWKDGGLWRVTPSAAYAWTQFPKDATRWKFEK